MPNVCVGGYQAGRSSPRNHRLSVSTDSPPRTAAAPGPRAAASRTRSGDMPRSWPSVGSGAMEKDPVPPHPSSLGAGPWNGAALPDRDRLLQLIVDLAVVHG